MKCNKPFLSSLVTSFAIVLGVIPVTCTTSFAQQARSELVPEPRVPNSDENGVDPGRGNVTKWAPAISIGDPKVGGLSYAPQLIAPGIATLASNWDYRISIGDYQPSGAKITAVVFPDSSNLFTSTSMNLVFNALAPSNGSALSAMTPNNPYDSTVQLNFTSSKGDKIIYFPIDGLYAYSISNYLPWKIIRPNGEEITYYYSGAQPGSYRPKYIFNRTAISSNFGYMIKFQNGAWTNGGLSLSSGVVVINLAQEYCDPLASTCSFLNKWPYILGTANGDFAMSPSGQTGSLVYPDGSTYTVFTSPEYRTQRITFPAGRVDEIQYDWTFINCTANQTFGTCTQPPACLQLVTLVGPNSIYPSCPGKYVTSYKRPEGTWSYARSFVKKTDGAFPSLSMRTVITDPMGQTKTYLTASGGQIESFTDGIARTTRIAVTPTGVVNEGRINVVSNPSGMTEIYVYDNRQNVLNAVIKSADNSQQLTASATYSASCLSLITCNKPESVTDRQGNTTNFIYDGVHGGVLSEMGPPPTLGAARPLKLNTWVQQFSWTKNATGALVQSTTPVWLIATETRCQTSGGSSVPSCDPLAVSVISTNEYGAAGGAEALLIKGVAISSAGTTLRTCYKYDIYGQRVSETKANANLGQCP
jgi:hypothetical protein